MSCLCDEDYCEHLMNDYDDRGFRKYCNLHRNGTYFGYDGYDKHGLNRRNFCKNGFFFMQKGELYDFATGSFFAPYVTTVGLYDGSYNLLAVGKLAKPLPTSRTTDTTILVNFDK